MNRDQTLNMLWVGCGTVCESLCGSLCESVDGGFLDGFLGGLTHQQRLKE